MTKTILGMDSETCPILPGLLAPPLACVSYSTREHTGLVTRQNATPFIESIFKDRSVDIVGQNFAYDAAVFGAHAHGLLPTIFKAYDERRVYDTMLNEQLFDIAFGQLRKGGYSLDAMMQEHFDRKLDKSTWRLKYGTLMDTPIQSWPQGAIDYAKEDASSARELFEFQVQREDDAEGCGNLHNGPDQARYAFSQQLMCTWGIRTDPERVAALEQSLCLEQSKLRRALMAEGLIEEDSRGKWVKKQKALQELVAKAYGGEPPTTGKGAISIDRKTLQGTEDPLLVAYSEYVANEKLLSTYVPVLKEGTVYPINSTFRLLESGRRGATKNMQTPPKKVGVRECYVPRPGFVFCSCDYDSLELRALAQIQLDLFGESPLADLYQSDPNADPHTRLAAEMFMGISYEEGLRRKKAGDPELDHFRKAAKACNFGLPGGLGPDTFMQFAKATYGYEMSRDEAERNKAGWLKRMRMQPFFDWVNNRVNTSGAICLPRSKRWRGGLGFCDGSNYLFQGPAADGACEAHYDVTRASYIERDSVLYGCRVVNFMHDELIVEMPEWKASEASRELSRVMNAAMMRHLPDIPVTSSPTLMRHWSKKAQERYDDFGNLQVWEAA